MGQEAKDTDIEEEVIDQDPEASGEAVATKTDETSGEDEGEGEEKKEEAQEVDVVRERSGSQPEVEQNHGFRKRVNKLNARNAETEKGKTEAEQRASIAEEKNALLELKLQQAGGANLPLVKPKPEDFDDGIHDPDFVKKHDEYTEQKIQRSVGEQVSKAVQQTAGINQQNLQSQDLERKQEQHYERVTKIGVKDYDEKENKALEILGNDNVNEIIKASKSSHLMLYYLGTNPEEAQKLADTLQSDPVRGVLDIGRLEVELKIKPKSNNPASDPDEDLEGSGAGKKVQRGPKGAKYE